MNVEKFIARGVTMTYQDDKTIIDGKTPFVYQCTIHYNHKEYTCAYTKGAAHVRKRGIDGFINLSYQNLKEELEKIKYGEKTIGGLQPIPPDIKEVLSSLQSDTRYYMENPSWEDFCSEIGYNEDSRKGYKVYEACRETFQELNRLFYYCFDEFTKMEFED